MKVATHFEQHFPTTVAVRHHEQVNEINAGVLGVLRELKAAYLTDPHENEVLTGTIATLGGYQTPTRRMFLDRPEPAIRELRDTIVQPFVETYLAEVFSESRSAIKFRMFSWANILAGGDWQAPHMHPTDNNLASGVYYLLLPDRPSPEGCIEFQCPHPLAVHHGQRFTRRIQPRMGDLILFPPYYVHYIIPFRGAQERAIVSFDVIAQSVQYTEQSSPRQ